jgi:5,10-methenyltetrahydrofolate synthetase
MSPSRVPYLENDADRKLQRERLTAARRAQPDRASREQALCRHVAAWLARADARTVGFYWPIRGEPDLRAVIADWLEAGPYRLAALPVVTGALLEFHAWSRDAPLRAGDFGIPVPAHGRTLQPDALLIPCVGFDAARYRLGYGGGFYDRTLAALVPWPLAVGVAFECGRIDALQPQPHDMQLDAVITESGVY